MSDVEIASLKSEVARLNQIITILLEQNEALKARVALSENGVPVQSANVAYSKNGVGNTNALNSQSENGIGNNNTLDTYSENRIGNNKANVATSKTGVGNIHIQEPLSKNGVGNTNATETLSENIPLTPGNVGALYRFLRTQPIGKVRYSSVKNAAALLLHFYNKGGGAYPELKKLTGLSKYGLAKYLRSLKKRGLIERDGWQKFKVTAHAISYLKQAGLGS